MKSQWLSLAAIVVLLTLCYMPRAAHAQEEVNQLLLLEQASVQVSNNILSSPKVKQLKGGVMVVAPADVQIAGQHTDQATKDMISRMIQSKLVTIFINKGGENLDVLDQVVLDKAMKNLQLDAKALADPDNWATIAEKTGASYVLLTSSFFLESGDFSSSNR